MKKLLTLLMAVVLVVTMAACTTPQPTEASTGPKETQKPTESQKPNETTASTEQETEPVDPLAGRYGGHLNVAIGSTSWSYLDPSKSTGAGNYLWTRMIWEAPLTRDLNGQIQPCVCDFELSADALTLKLWVREGKKFHDGTSVEIDDVVASVMRATHKSPRSYVSDYVESVKVENGVATFKFKEYNEKTMYYIACTNPFIGVMPKEIAEKYSYESKNFIDNVAEAIGTGPYKITDYREGEYVEMARFEDYVVVDEGLTGYAAPRRAYMDTVTFYFPTDVNNAAIAMLNGEYDYSAGILGPDYYDRMEAAGIEKRPGDLSTTGRVMFFNTFGNSITSNDPNLRKAIVAAIDIPEFMSIDAGECWVTGNLTLDELYHTDIFDKADYFGEDNIELAKKYLAASNYQGEPVQLVVPSGQTDIFTMVDAYLKAAGINTVLVPMEGTAFTEFRADPKNNWDFYFGSVALNNTPVLLSDTIMKTDYNSEKKDALLAELNKLPAGSAAYVAKWKELASQMVEDCAVIGFGRQYGYYILNADLQFDNGRAYYFNAYWEHPEEHKK